MTNTGFEMDVGLKAYLRGWWRTYMVDKWPYWIAAIFMAVSNILAYGIGIWALSDIATGGNPYDMARPIGTFVGLRELGGIIDDFMGVPSFPGFEGYHWFTGETNFFRMWPNPLLEPTVNTMLGILLGGLVAALLSKEFAVKVPRDRIEYIFAVAGGLLMGIGAVFMYGCPIVSTTNIGTLSFQGMLMVVGMVIGSYFGAVLLRYLEQKRFEQQAPFDGAKYRPLCHFEKTRTIWPKNPENLDGGEHWGLRYQPYVALIVLGLVGFGLWNLASMGFPHAAVLIFACMLTGVAMERGGMCFAHAYREPFLSGFAEMTRAMTLLYILLIIGFLPFKLIATVNPNIAYGEIFGVSPAGFGIILGGIFFGIGMAINGACVSDSLWRTAEGQVKIWIALLVLITSTAWLFPLRNSELFNTVINPYGTGNIYSVYLPKMLGGYIPAVVVMVLFMLLWAGVMTWAAGRTFRKYLEG
ncbi:MAG: YeeE/YedE family protein [Euryarchaeota archaeon]|nr:YeeE/YedE family protein [Euryarchaeota archaeon]